MPMKESATNRARLSATIRRIFKIMVTDSFLADIGVDVKICNGTFHYSVGEQSLKMDMILVDVLRQKYLFELATGDSSCS